MTQPPSDPSSQTEGSRSWSVEQICQKFQAAHQQGKRIRIEDVLKKVKTGHNNRLLRGLMIVEISFRRRQGESPQQAEYESRFPGRGLIVAEVFGLLGQSPTQSVDDSDSHTEKHAPKHAEVEEFAVEVLEEGTRHKQPSASKPAPRAGVDPFDVEIVDLPSRKSPAANRQPAPAPGRREPAADPIAKTKTQRKKSPAQEDSLDEIISHMEAPPPRMKQVRDVDDDEDRPKVKKLKHKKKKKKSSEGMGDPMEFVIPLSLLGISLVINLIFAAVFVPPGIPVWMYLLVKVGFILVTGIVTTIALFAAAAILGTDYGYLNVGLIKIGAICLTQIWLAELAFHTPDGVTLVVGISAWIATYVMFVMFFQLEGMEAVASMAIVCLAHRMAYTFLFIGLFAFWMSGGLTGLEDPANDAIAKQLAKEMEEDVAREVAALKPYQELAKKFGEALLEEKYSDAYAMMSSTYRKQKTLEKFTDFHKNARAKFGKPLRVDAKIGTVDKDDLDEEEYGSEAEAPKATRKAWMGASFVLELKDGKVERAADCWFLMVDDAGKTTIARFEYEQLD